ncbi:MAG: hypothetical protein WBO29_07035 [Albidovulum sp.]
MSLKDALIAGLDTVPGCETICYVDMDSGLVLASHCHIRRPQEFYDRIASLATKLMQSPSLADPSGKVDTDEKSIFVFGHDRTHVFVKAKTFPEHAICYMCASNADTDALSAAVMTNRETIANAM